MNIFFLDINPFMAARWQVDKHVTKMPLESAQILCAVSWRYGVEAPMKEAYKNHPMVLWAGDSCYNWRWLCYHGIFLCQEYYRRYDREHACLKTIMWCIQEGGRPASGKMTPPPQCMPKKYHQNDVIKAYRNYYLGEKAGFAAWTYPSEPPPWWKGELGKKINKKSGKIIKYAKLF